MLIIFLSLVSIYFFWRFLLERMERSQIVNSLTDGVVLVGHQGHIREINFSACRILKLSKKKFLKKKFPKGTPLLDQCFHLIDIVKNTVYPATEPATIDSGKKSYCDLIAIPTKKGVCLILRDTSSDRKILEMGKDFVASASHELKTPITIIRGFAEMLQDTKELPPEIREEILEKIVKNCCRMDVLIKNLLTIADIDHLPILHYQECELTALIEESIQMTCSVYPKASVEFIKPKEEVIAEIDPALFELAILNLLSNAAKYSKEKIIIIVRLKCSDEDVMIEVQDQGIGIPEADLPMIFERFYTVHKEHSRKLGGAGLGLSIVKTIIDKHDGSISVHSQFGKGSTFQITVPLSQN